MANELPVPAGWMQTMAGTASEYISQYATPIIGAVGLIIGAALTYLSTRERISADKDIARDSHAILARRNTLFASIKMVDAQTNQFRALLEGYQHHVDQLTAEVHGLREEVTKLRSALAIRLTMCADCEKLEEWRDAVHADVGLESNNAAAA